MAVTLSSAALDAQTANRVTQRIDATRVRLLPSHHPLWANPGNDKGALPPDQKLDQMTLLLARSQQQQQAFESFLADQQDPASPDYHHWLTPSEVGDRFGLPAQDIAGITGWLQSQGLHVNWISPSRIFIGFGGTAADLGRALHTELHSYAVRGAKRISVSSDPMIPEALVPVVRAVRGLYTIEEKPLHRAESMQSDSPLMTTSTGGHLIAPADFATIYDLPGGFTGSGQSIGIVGRARTNFADFANFRQWTGSSFSNPTEIVPTAFGGVDPGPAYTLPPAKNIRTVEQSEATLDVTRAGSIAPSANLLLVITTEGGGDIDADAQYLVQTSPVPVQVITISFGDCESNAGPSGVAFWDALFQQGAAEGISSFASSGDAGASGCDVAFETPSGSPRPNSPNYICSSSYVTCVGGTEFDDTANPSAYWSSGEGYGRSSALSYIPEGAWNEPLDGNSSPQPASSGGGVSSVIATPNWQRGTGVPAARSGRYTPDICFSASDHDGYFACFAAGQGDCVAGSNGSYPFEHFAGTSASAPSMAAVAALLDQLKGEPQGNLNPGLYRLAAAMPAAFHDVTVASSGVIGCDIGIPSMCNNSIPSASGLSGGQPGYLVTPGYDEVTGLGSLDVQTFLNNFAAKLAPTVTVTPSAASITILQPLTVSVTVSGGDGNPMPTGSVGLTSGIYTSATIKLVNGNATFNIPARSLTAGGNLLTATYTPDAASSTVYSNSSGLSWVAVNLLIPSVTITPSPPAITTAQSLTATVAVSGGSGNPTPTGSVSLSGGGFFSSATLNGGAASFNLLAGLLPPGSDMLLASYAPDAPSNATYSNTTGSTTMSVTGTALHTPAVSITPAFYDVATIEPLPVTIAVSGGSGNPTPIGSVTLICGSYSPLPTALVQGAAAIVIPPGSLDLGYDSLVAIYTPDSASASIYNNTSGSNSVLVVDVVKSAPAIAIRTSSTSIGPTQSLSLYISVSSNNGYFITPTGSLILSGGGYTSAALTLDLANVNNATFTIPAGALAVGADVLTVTYTPDAQSSWVFSSASSTTTVTVGSPSFTITASSVLLAPGATTGNSSIVTVSPSDGFTGAVVLTATLASSPAGAQYPPTLSFGSTSPVTISGANAGTATLTITTTAPSSAALAPSRQPGAPWVAAGGATLACILLFALPRRRRWRNILGSLALLVAFVGVVSCNSSIGGSGSGGGGAAGGGGNPGTTAGTYTITVTGVSGTMTAANTLTLVVQ